MLRDTRRVCVICQKEYSPKQHNQKACCLDCAIIAKGNYDKYFNSTEKGRVIRQDIRDRRKEATRKASSEWYLKNREEVNIKRAEKRKSRTAEEKIRDRDYQANRRYLTWELYFKDLVRLERRKTLTVTSIINLLNAQNSICAISGIPFTRQRGSIYNPSIDRIISGGSYNIDNIHLVCRAINNWRSNTSLEEFIEICKKIAQYNADNIGC